MRGAVQVPTNDPFTLVPVMAAVTEHLGFSVTGSIPAPPAPTGLPAGFHALDHLTAGRIGWNVVTGYLTVRPRGAGRTRQTAHDTRYDIADEFMQVVYKLWEGSWEDGAVVRDAARGVYTDPGKVHRVRHDGEYFSLDAIHLCEPSPQRSPVIYQAGTSTKGQAFAAAHAECVFVGDASMQVVANSVRTLREQIVAAGRAVEDVKIFALVAVVVDDSDELARAKFDDYQSYGIHEGALALMSGWSNVDLAEFDIDARADAQSTDAIQTTLRALGTKSVREWAEFLVVGGAAPVIVGSASHVVDELQRWMDVTGVDGFNLAYTVMPECMTDFVDKVVPEMQRRGIYKTGYEHGTMRGKIFGHGARLPDNHPAARFRISDFGKGNRTSSERDRPMSVAAIQLLSPVFDHSLRSQLISCAVAGPITTSPELPWRLGRTVGDGPSTGHQFGFRLRVQGLLLRVAVAIGEQRLIGRRIVLVAGPQGVQQFVGDDDMVFLFHAL